MSDNQQWNLQFPDAWTTQQQQEMFALQANLNARIAEMQADMERAANPPVPPSTFDYVMRSIAMGVFLAVIVCVVYVLLHLLMRLG